MSEIELFIREEAALRGIDGDTAVAVAKSEGGVEEWAVHASFPTGDSWYSYQLHWGGPEYPQFGVPGQSVAGMGNSFSSLTGWAPGDPAAARDSTRYALNVAKRDGWGAWYGAAAIGITGYDGIDQSVAWDPNSQTWDYETTAGGDAVTAPASTPPPSYDATFPAFAQNDDWSCSCTSARWALWSYARQPSESWLENDMLADGIVSKQAGLLDSSGAGLAGWLQAEYGPAEYGGYQSTSNGSVSFAEVAAEAATGKHPLMIGGRSWGAGGHWTGVRGYDSASNRLLLANPASGYDGIAQTMSPEQFWSHGPFSLVRLVNPAAEGQPVPPRPPSTDPYAPWRSTIGSGILDMMAADQTLPAQRSSTWLPLGTPPPSDVESCFGKNGWLYYWLLTTNTGYRLKPS